MGVTGLSVAHLKEMSEQGDTAMSLEALMQDSSSGRRRHHSSKPSMTDVLLVGHNY